MQADSVGLPWPASRATSLPAPASASTCKVITQFGADGGVDPACLGPKGFRVGAIVRNAGTKQVYTITEIGASVQLKLYQDSAEDGNKSSASADDGNKSIEDAAFLAP